MPITDDIVMRLILKGQDPAEAARVIGQPLRAMEAELNASIARQTAAHKKASEAQTAETQKQAKAEVREHLAKTRQLTQAIQEVERAQKKAAQGMATNWRRTMEDLENLTVVATGAWGIIAGGAARLKDLGDSVATTTNIYGSLKGSIDTMREATKGQIADIDLITTKNRAAQKELILTDQQFGLVAASADAFADALGTNTKDALDGLIDGLATGRVKSLAMAGVIVSEKEAYAAYAEKIGVATDKLSEHDQKVAKIEASLRAMDKKLIETGGSVETFADKWEQANAQVSNLADQMKLGIGEGIIWLTDKFDTFTVGVTEAILQSGLFFAKAQAYAQAAMHPFDKSKAFVEAAMAPIMEAQAALDGFHQSVANEQGQKAAADAKRLAGARERQRTGTAYDASGAVGGDTTSGRGKAGSEIVYVAPQKEFEGIERLLYMAAAKRIERLVKDQEEIAGGDVVKHGFAGGQYTNPQIKQFEEAQGMALASRAKIDADPGADAAVAAQKAGEISQRFNDEVNSVVDQAGGGILGKLLFGPGGLNESLSQMDEFTRGTLAVVDTVSQAGQAMAGALGSSTAAALAGDKGFRAAIKESTRAVLISLSTQAFTHSLMETAMGVAAVARGNPAAGGHFAAAALFAGVGVAAGLGARAIGPSATATVPVSASTSSRAPSSFSGSASGSSGSERGGDTYVFNINHAIGTVDAGYMLDQIHDKFRRTTGKEIGART